MLELRNSVGIIVTETWLEESVLDVEVQTMNYEVFRADRKGRKCGGAAFFLRTEIQCKLVLAYSNGAVEALVIK